MKTLLTYILLFFTIFQASAYKIGDIVETPEGDKGVVFFINQEKVLLVSAEEKRACWRHEDSEGADVFLFPNTDEYSHHGFSGKKCTEYLVSLTDKFIFPVLDSIHTDRNWFLPSLVEMQLLLLSKDYVNPSIESLGGDKITNTEYNTVNEKTGELIYTCYYADEVQRLEVSAINKYMMGTFRAIYQMDAVAHEVDSNNYYYWNTTATTHQITVTPNSATTYTLLATDKLTGCQSSASKTVLVAGNGLQEVYDTICSGETYERFGIVASETGNYTSEIGTDSCSTKVNLHLTVAPKYTQVFEDEICYGQYYGEHGFSLTPFVQGAYSDTLKYISHMGCDSILVLNLKVNPIAYDTLTKRVCQSEGYKDADFEINANQKSGLHFYTIEKTGENGCRLFHTLALQVDSVYTFSLVAKVQKGTDYKLNGFKVENVQDDGSYTQKLKTVNGCDSTVNLNIMVIDTVVKPVVVVPLKVDICEGDTFPFRGQKLTAAGVYTDSLENDTVVLLSELNLAVHPVYTFDLYDTLCVGSAELPDVVLPPVVKQTAYGCDSSVVQHIHYKISQPTQVTKTICQGSTYEWNGMTLTEPGVYTAVITLNGSGCDSVVTLDLREAEAVSTVLDQQICQGGSFRFKNQDLTEAGIYNDTLVSQFGCDSIVTLNLSVREMVLTSVAENICEGETYTFGNRQLAEAGVYADTLVAATGCDSIVLLTLSVGKSVSVALNDTVCEGEEYAFAGEAKQYPSGYVKLVTRLNTAWGCDSSVTVHLTVLPASRTAISDTVVVGSAYTRNGFQLGILNQLGSADYVLHSDNEMGCDSIVTLHLFVRPLADNHIVPTVFSPANQDGNNDVFMRGYDVYIYDRYGNLICHSSDGWDGRYRGGFADPGVYVYVVTMSDGQVRRGTVEVLKN